MRVNRVLVRAGIATAFTVAALVPSAVAAFAQPDHAHAKVALAGDPDEGGELHARFAVVDNRMDAPDPPIIRG